MENELNFDYYYGKEAEQFSFYRIPRILIKDEKFKGISNDAKLLYGLMLDRMSLSMKNGWFDDQNRAYIIYTIKGAMEDLGCGTEKCCKIFKELDSKDGIGLIERKKLGQGKADIIYVKNFLGLDAGIILEDNDNTDNESQEFRKSKVKTLDKDSDRISENEIESQEVGKSKVKGEDKENPSNSEIEILVSGKSKCNYTNNNYTDISYTNPINPSIQEKESKDDGHDQMDEVTAYMEIIKDNIEYDTYMKCEDRPTKEYIEEIYNVICDIVCVKRKSVRIDGEEYPYELVKSRFLKLKYYHVKYVIDKLTTYPGKISNLKGYMITSLYNAPTSANFKMQNEVRHDIYGGGWNE